MAEQTLLAPGIHHFSLELEDDDDGSLSGQWPLPQGLLSQTYGIKGEKTVLVDWNPPIPEAVEVLKELLSESGFIWGQIDYFLFLGDVCPGAVLLARENPGARFLLAPDRRNQAINLGVPEEKISSLSDGEHLDLGQGRILRFTAAESSSEISLLMAWEESSGCLFSGDVFSGFGVVEDKYYQDQLSSQEADFMEEETYRAFACRWSTRTPLLKAVLEHLRTAAWPVRFLAPSQGMIHRRDLSATLELWNRWLGYTQGDPEREIALVVFSGCPKDLEEELLNGVVSESADLEILHLPDDGPDRQKAVLLRSRGIIIAGKPQNLSPGDWLKGLGAETWGSRILLAPDGQKDLPPGFASWTVMNLEGLSPREAAGNLARRVKRGE